MKEYQEAREKIAHTLHPNMGVTFTWEYILELSDKLLRVGGEGWKIAIIKESAPLAEQDCCFPSLIHTDRNLKQVIWEAE